jgi:DNA-binding response OmpR family regulator
MRVLVVEDDPALGLFLKKRMQMEGHRVELAEDGEAGLARAAEIRPDLMLLDLGLPRRDGIEVLTELRATNSDTAVLVLSARCDLESRVRCLDLGADDCMLKPFSFFELLARCRALLRRRGQVADPVLRHGDLELHRAEHRVTRAGAVINLTAKEFALLEYLLLHRGECISRSELLTEVWQIDPATGTNVVDVYVNYLRRKVDGGVAHGARPSLIDTVRGVGYRLGQLSGEIGTPQPVIAFA